jgi:hypothetical protein
VPIIGDVPPGQAVPSTAVGTARDLGLNGSRPGSRSGVFPVSLRTVLALGRTVLDGAGLLPRCDLDLAPGGEIFGCFMSVGYPGQEIKRV